ncbi:glutamate--tRNA ligase [Wolbachia endosymbiont of Pentidionis agamae]|uniref:glutamate--tRNA ligase n=1 Tax=Wolbachia endosymbiont of Pentidionis agamae TaxID=3110435 RepID=UPI002FD29ABD
MLTRFAPSPTGYLHVGNLRTALICWIYARQKSGKFILRFDDTDAQRSDNKYIQAIEEDLKWVGIDWNVSFRQSEKFKHYDEIFAHLIRSGHIYSCYETIEELEIKRKLQLAQGLPPIYDRSGLFLSEQEKNEYEQEGRKPYFRFKLDDNQDVMWKDEVKGEIRIVMSSISDPIIKRNNGSYTYMLPSVIDDIDCNITNIIRGEDHITNTAVQIQMIRALKGNTPIFSHLPLLYFDDNKISKRDGGLTVESFKDYGIEPMSLNSYLTKIGTSDSIEPYTSLQSLVDTFDIQKINSASTKFNIDDVYRINGKILQQTSFEVVKDRLSQVQIDSSRFWYSVRSNISRFSDVVEWWKICTQDIQSMEVDRTFVKVILDSLPYGNWDENTLSDWVKAIQNKVDIKTKDLFLQLRMILTGKKNGPELAKLLPLIGREAVVARLNNNSFAV